MGGTELFRLNSSAPPVFLCLKRMEIRVKK